MKEIKILHLFPQLLSLYGEYGNVKITEKVLKDKGYTVSVSSTDYPCDIPDFSEFDFIYLGSGTEKNIMIALNRLLTVKELIDEFISSGKCMLATGNAMSLFGQNIVFKSEKINALGIFEYECEMLSDRRFIGDTLSSEDNIFGARLIGAVNTASIYTGIKDHLLVNLLGKDLGNDKKSAYDGIISQKFIGVQYIGPFAVKNPPVLENLCKMITDDDISLAENENIVIAYKRALDNLSQRL